VEAPAVTLNVAVLNNDALLPALRKGDLDIAVTHTRQFSQPDLTLQAVRKDEFIVFCAAGHRLARRRTVAPEDLADERWAAAASATGDFGPLRLLGEAFEERGLPAPRIALVTDLVLFKLQTVAASDLLGTGVKGHIHAAAARLGLKVLSVKGLDWTRPVAVAYRKDAYLSPAGRRFIDVFRATARSIGASAS
jgi:DNA-binding transcriptional LysR family regulator